MLLTHNETSTGVQNDVAAIGALAREYDVLLLVDSISALGAADLRSDAWGVDVAVTASQKALDDPARPDHALGQPARLGGARRRPGCRATTSTSARRASTPSAGKRRTRPPSRCCSSCRPRCS